MREQVHVTQHIVQLPVRRETRINCDWIGEMQAQALLMIDQQLFHKRPRDKGKKTDLVAHVRIVFGCYKRTQNMCALI